MTALTASFPTDSPPRGNVPADDLVRRLCSPSPSSAPGPFMAAFQAVISFGLLPLILWPARWTALVDNERADLLELISRWRSRIAPTDAGQLDHIAYRLRPRPILMVLPWLMAGFVGLLMALLLSQGETINGLGNLTYNHFHKFQTRYSMWDDRPRVDYRFAGDAAGQSEYFTEHDFGWQIHSHLFDVWLWGLISAYAIHWYAVRSHARAVNSLAKWTNRLAAANGFPALKPDAMNTGLGFFWVICAVGFCTAGAWWAIPMVLGGAMQRRYSRRSGQHVRSALGYQLRDGFAMTVATQPTSRVCSAVHCGARLPDAANYCPRCGSPAVSARSSRV